jgi:monooxygenase
MVVAMASEAGSSPPEHVDVLILGAGLSGVGAACHVKRGCPDKSFVILEARGAIGGTWDLFRYPGIRSDSDMFTLGYSFRPWKGPMAIADGASIRRYIEETAREHGIDRTIRYHHRVVRAEWSTADARWLVTAERSDTGETARFSCRFLYGCTGYYRYDEGYTPPLEGKERFGGRIVHPQHWPEDLDYDGRRVVVIGSGATAVTLVPALAERAAHVTMLQRTPTYIVSVPARDALADALRGRLSDRLAYGIVRAKNVALAAALYQLSRRAPRFTKRVLRRGIRRQLPRDYDVDRHFSPPYDPWDQRLCAVPDADLFKALRCGKVEIVTDRIETFSEKGIRLSSGTELEADIVVTATGLELLVLGGLELFVDGRRIDPSKTVTYKGMMLSGVPNMALAIGYTNASWTLKCDLVGEYVCRLLRHMDERGYRACTPKEPDPSLPLDPVLDLKAGYVERALSILPKQGARPPWRLYQNYLRDILMLRRGPVEDEAVEFSRAPHTGAPAQVVAIRPDAACGRARARRGAL